METNKFIYGSLMIHKPFIDVRYYIKDSLNGVVAWSHVFQESIGQYTGLKDKNGKEIYEGDILKYSAHDGYGLFPGRLTIKWIDDSACFGYSHSDQSFSPGYVSPFTEHDELKFDVLSYSEIIGNIYENPELLK
jgi:uncharacterized phage protein (TIGR01671 family)